MNLLTIRQIMRKNSFLNIAAALWMGVVAAVGLSACSSEDNLSINPQPAQNEVHTYHVCIPASFGDDAQTRAVTPGTDAVSGKPNLIGQFMKSENVVVHNMTTGEDAYSDSWTYLHPDADNATTANLTGDLSFNSSIAEGQTLRLIYNSSDKYFTYSVWNADPAQIVSEPGTLAGLSNYDFAVADVTISSVSGSGPYTLTTSPANFENLQSMFKFTFTGLPTGVGVQMLSVSSENLYISTSHSPVNGYEQYYTPVYISLDDAARAANGAGVVYAAIRFRETSEDNITFTVTGTDGNTYGATKHTTGFSNGKYYTPTIALRSYPQNLADVTIADIGCVIASDGKIYENTTSVPGGSTARAMIAYVGDAKAGGTGAATCAHGLAIALDEASTTQYYWHESAGLVSTWAASNTVTGISQSTTTGWRLPTVDDFKYMIQGCGGDTYSADLPAYPHMTAINCGTLDTKVYNLTGNHLQFCWTSNESETSCGYYYNFDTGKLCSQGDGGSTCYVRAVLAF